MTSFVSFPEFFRALYDRDPFPWQALLAERGAEGEWPAAISLPTASGKTACLDAAVYALAAQADCRLSERTAPRRIWFIVDRRIVVDEAHERASNLAAELAKAADGPLKIVADRLRSLVGGGSPGAWPLAVARLRGGTARDDSWAYDPAQPAILCSTVDQIGSSLLFRSYGHDDLTAPIWSGLASHDSLILLDEAHCAVPFLQTLHAIASYRGPSWAAEPIVTPFAWTIFSATLPPQAARDIPTERRFPRNAAERALALDHATLEERLSAPKPTTLVVAPKANKDTPRATLATEIAAQVMRHLLGHRGKWPGSPRLGVMVNRVTTAQEIADLLARGIANSGNLDADVILLTGRMRPLERDALVSQWSPLLRSGATQSPSRPVIVVTTQCLEVGADFSFEVLVTECASLDALRQRFGRLDRLGKFRHSTATIVITEADTKERKADETDPIYGDAIFETWQWLQSISATSNEGAVVDFGVKSMDAHVERLLAGESGAERLSALLAPSLDAPVLLPAHLDLLCQTAPRPSCEPEIAFFLHGKRPHVPEVRVLWRAELLDGGAPKDEAAVMDQLALVPPTSPETISVPRHRLRSWLKERTSTLDEGDVEGRSTNDAEREPLHGYSRDSKPVFVIWGGPERSRISSDPQAIEGGDTIVLSASLGLPGIAQSGAAGSFGLGHCRTDLAEPAALVARPRAVLRLRGDLWTSWNPPESFRALIDAAEAEDFDYDEFHEQWHVVREVPITATNDTSITFPGWLPQVIAALGNKPRLERITGVPGVTLIGPKRNLAAVEDDYADETDALSETDEKADGVVTLSHHCTDVAAAARRFAAACLPTPFQTSMELAAPLHDLGKIDPRFQVMLHDGDEVASETAANACEPLAKSAKLPRQIQRRQAIREEQRLPRRFRHEMVSLQLAGHCGLLPTSENRELVAHLVASHHGHARPSFPDTVDPQPPSIDLASVGLALKLDEVTRSKQPLNRRSAMAAQIAERFWNLTRRHGWWGLAYIEAVFRLADWHASRGPTPRPKHIPQLPLKPVPISTQTFHHLRLSAIDGASPLGFLAALGVLRVLALKRADLRPALSWVPDSGKFAPRLTTNAPLQAAGLSAIVAERLAREEVFPSQITGDPERQKLSIDVKALRACMAPISTQAAVREFAPFWAAFFNETSPHPKDGSALKTRFDFHSGQMKIVANVATLRERIDASVLNSTLFDGWQYVAQPSLRWDPLDEKRRYALQADDPSNKSKNPIFTDIGANLLAIEGLHYFPMAPDRFGRQAGFNRERYAKEWTWPLWDEPLSSDAVFSLLHAPRGKSRTGSFFQSRMAESGKGYRSFSPGRPIP